MELEQLFSRKWLFVINSRVSIYIVRLFHKSPNALKFHNPPFLSRINHLHYKWYTISKVFFDELPRLLQRIRIFIAMSCITSPSQTCLHGLYKLNPVPKWIAYLEPLEARKGYRITNLNTVFL